MKLVNGIPKNNPKLCKEVQSAAKPFESHYTKASGIIFEIAICSSSPLVSLIKMATFTLKSFEFGILYGIMTTWIKALLMLIKKSQNRGREAAIKTHLKISNGQKPKQGTQGQENLRIPQCYACDVPKGAQGYEATLMFTPAGSTKDFNSHFVKSILDGDNARRDFPFKECLTIIVIYLLCIMKDG